MAPRNGVLSMHYGLCGGLTDIQEPRYLPCASINEEPSTMEVPDNQQQGAPSSNNTLFDPSMKERKDEIDALRNRVDVILNKMVQNSGDDVTRLRQKIAEMRTGPPAPQSQAQQQQQQYQQHHHEQQQMVKSGWGAGVMCPMSPAMTTMSKASVTPSTVTEVHANTTSNYRPSDTHHETLREAKEPTEEEERDEDEEIDEMNFDFGVAPLSMSKSAQLVEPVSIMSESKVVKLSCKDPPAFLKASESMLPDPGGDASYCSGNDNDNDNDNDDNDNDNDIDIANDNDNDNANGGSRCDSPAPESLLFEAIVRKASSVAKEKLRQEQAALKRAVAPTPEHAVLARPSKSAEAKTVASNDPPASPSTKELVPEPQSNVERSASLPPPVININIPKNKHPDSSDRLGLAVSGSGASESSLSHAPSKDEIVMVEEVTEQRIRDPYGDKGVYTGVLVKRRPHGRGTMKYDDGRHYEGHWNHGRWHGVGRAIFANHDIFEGSYDMDQRHGHGMYQWNDGRVYTGQFFQDQRQGRGTYTWPDGAVYQGEFKAGHRHGQGMYRFADGSVYTGEWENGKYHGVGECRWSDGRSYRGEWKDGRANGYGVETRPNGTIRHDGEWKEDRPIRESKKAA